MNIAAEKINEAAFNDIYGMLEQYSWLKYYLNGLIELWNMCDEKEQQELIKELLSRFVFIEGRQLSTIANDIVKKIDEWKFDVSRTYIAAIADKNEVDGSIAGLQFMKNKFDSTKGWNESRFYPSITKAANEIRNNDNLILFDDFLGSGKTIIKKIFYLRQCLDQRSISLNTLKVVVYAGMEFGVNKVISECNIEVYCHTVLKRGITDFESESSIEVKKLLMKSLESKLSKKFKGLKLQDHSLGYKESETLFQIQDYNCPNNLFPIFWWPTLQGQIARKTLFQRIR
jgi:hypothetical protein